MIKKMVVKKIIFSSLIPVFLSFLAVAFFLILVTPNEDKKTTEDNTISIGLAPEVERYRDIVIKKCAEYGIPDKVSLVLAIMMQESGGRVPDVMQSSESLGLPPNSLQPAESIDAGVKYIAGLLKATEDEDTAIQSYNYGGGFIGWLSSKGGKYTKELAVQFSNEMSKKMGWSSYGDKEYVPHVRRYMGTGVIDSEFAKKVMDEAIKYQGYPYVFGGVAPGAFDCSSLTQWCYKVAGVNIPRTAQQQYDVMAIVKNEKEAQAGDLVFFHSTYDAGDYITHVGIYVGDGKMYHAGDPLGYADLNSSYWQQHIVGYGRVK